jgi:hypothetical protein
MKSKPDPDLAKWCEALAAPIVVDVVPPGWLTLRQLAQKLKKAENTTGSLLRRAVAEGRAERQSFRIVNGQVTRPTPHYRLR